MNLLQVLHQYGQSIWLDGFERGWISGGGLQRYIEEDGLTGVRSNFQSLQAAIESQEYDRDFITLAQQGISQTARSDYDYVIVRDLQLAADLLKPVYTQTQGRDGYVQIDLPPDTLLNAETAIASAQNIWQAVGWSNLLLRIPATPLLLPVIEQLISDHINVNATFVFSPTLYEQVFNRYLIGLERLIQQGELLGDVVCFASASMGCLDAMMHPFMASSDPTFSVIQARLLYQHYQMLHHSDRWQTLPEEVKPLRLIWDCTDIPPESAWCYLQQLAFPETGMLLSPSTVEMYRGVSLIRNHWTDGKQSGRLIGEPREYLLDEQVKQLVDAEMARTLREAKLLLTAFH
jgi:transaldolase